MRAFIGVYRLQIEHVTDHLELFGDAVAAMDVASSARDIQRLAAIVALDQRDRLRRHPAGIAEPAQPQRALKAEGDLGLHVGELLLDELRLRKGPAELLAIEGILARRVPAEFGRPHRAP